MLEKTKAILDKPRFNYKTIIGLIGGFIYVIFIETSYFRNLDSIIRVLIIMGFAVFCAVTGVRLGSPKEILAEVGKYLSKEGTAEEILNQLEQGMHLFAVKAGELWEQYFNPKPKIKKLEVL